jgi:formylglycine-generating enzyme
MKILNAAVCLASLLLCSPSVSQEAKCPADMVVAREGVCIDRYEWPNKAGVKPLVYASGIAEAGAPEVSDAETLCASVGKRVCTKPEWQHACGDKYPYGDVFDPTACNTEKKFRKIDELKVAKYNKKELEHLDQSAPSGSYEKCRSPSGAYDMVGNGEEWVKCTEGKYGWCLMGRYWGQRGSCNFVVAKHHPRWHYNTTSARCCLDMKNE